jgi:hypothetical protein
VAECGTHALVDAVLGPVATGEQTLATQLISRLTSDMLVLADRNFYSYQAWQQASSTGAALLWRVSRKLLLPVLHALPEGLLHRGRTSFGMLKRMRRTCRVRPVLPSRSAFTGFRFPREVIVLTVRCYLRYGLSYRDVEELLTERGVQADHVTVYRWVQRFTHC